MSNLLLKTFDNEKFGSIRTTMVDDKFYFVANDVAKALGYKIPKDAISAHCKGAVKHRLPTKGGMQEMSIIGEGDFVRLVTHSKLPSAQEFESWCFDEVIPTVMKTGTYSISDDAKLDVSISVDSSDYQKKIKAEAMLMNARSRMASSWERLVKATSDDTIKKIGISYWGNTLADKKVIPLPVSTGDSGRTSHQLSYFCKKIGKEPSWASALGKKLKRLGLTKTAENGISREDLINGKQIPVFYWYDDVVLPKLEELGYNVA